MCVNGGCKPGAFETGVAVVTGSLFGLLIYRANGCFNVFGTPVACVGNVFFSVSIY